MRRGRVWCSCMAGTIGIHPIFNLFGLCPLSLGAGKFHGLLGRGNGLGRLLHPGMGHSQIEIELGILGLKPQGLLVMFDRLLKSACIDQCDAQVVVGLGIIGFQPQGLLVMFDCLLQSACIGQGVAQVIVGFGDNRASAAGPVHNVRSPPADRPV